MRIRYSPDKRKNTQNELKKRIHYSEKQLNEPDMDFIVRINGATQPKLK